MILKPQDVVVCLLLAIHPDDRRTYVGVAKRIGLSPAECHNATARALQAGLIRHGDDEHRGRPTLKVRTKPLLEFLLHGIRYVFVPDRGPRTRGMPTAHAAPPLNAMIVDNDTSPVWPDPHGTVRGESFQPLYPNVVIAARDPQMYAALALVDAIRGGRARERELASTLLTTALTGG